MPSMECPCGEKVEYDKCCEPLHRGERTAKTAVELMRSRYSAYATKEISYIIETHDPKTRKDLDESSTRAWAENSQFHELEVLSTTNGGEQDSEGEVEFMAFYSSSNEERLDDEEETGEVDEDGESDGEHHEIAKFRKIDSAWYYVDGTVINPETIVRESPKVGRNDPCICGSGKKFKKCCG